MDKYHEERLERGRRFSEWFRRVAVDPRTGKTETPSRIARIVGMSPTRVGVMLNNDCVEKGLVSLPKPENIDKIAEKYDANADEGKVICGYLPEKSADNVYIAPPGTTRYDLVTGHVLFVPEEDPIAMFRARLVEAYILGQNNNELMAALADATAKLRAQEGKKP